MAIAFRAAATATNVVACCLNSSTIVISKPTGTVQNDVMVACISAYNGGCCSDTQTITAPSGWVQQDNNAYATNQQSAVFTKQAGASEPSTYTFTISYSLPAAGALAVGGISSYSGCNTTTWIDATTTAQTNTSSTNFTCPSITTVTANTMVLNIVHLFSVSSETFTNAAGTTNRINANNASVLFVNQADKAFAATGATGTRVPTGNHAAVTRGVTIALRPPTGTVFNDTISETATSSDSEVGTANDNGTLSETGTATTSQTGLATDAASLAESDTSSDSYTGGKTTSDTISETATSSDSEIGSATGKATLNETGTSSDLINGASTVNGSMTEQIISTDAFAGAANDNASLTESDTSSDSYTLIGGATYNDFITETTTSSDSETGNANDSASLTELVAANDNYTDVGPFPNTGTVTQTGPSDGKEDSWARYLKWLAKQKKKQFKERAEKIGLAPSKARQIAEIATQEAAKQQVSQNEEMAQKATLALYENVWQQMAIQKRAIEDLRINVQEKQEEDDEEEFFMMVM